MCDNCPDIFTAVNEECEYCTRFIGDVHMCNQKDEYDSTPLHYAIINGSLPIIKILFERGADPYIKDDNDVSPYELAESMDLREVVVMFDTFFMEIKEPSEE